jgi:hypothetical protein
MCNDILEINNKKKYRKKIKGFHLAFNITDKVAESSKYKYQPEGTAEEIRLNA